MKKKAVTATVLGTAMALAMATDTPPTQNPGTPRATSIIPGSTMTSGVSITGIHGTITMIGVSIVGDIGATTATIGRAATGIIEAS
jgi:hypothetical protein